MKDCIWSGKLAGGSGGIADGDGSGKAHVPEIILDKALLNGKGIFSKQAHIIYLQVNDLIIITCYFLECDVGIRDNIIIYRNQLCNEDTGVYNHSDRLVKLQG